MDRLNWQFAVAILVTALVCGLFFLFVGPCGRTVERAAADVYMLTIIFSVVLPFVPSFLFVLGVRVPPPFATIMRPRAGIIVAGYMAAMGSAAIPPVAPVVVLMALIHRWYIPVWGRRATMVVSTAQFCGVYATVHLYMTGYDTWSPIAALVTITFICGMWWFYGRVDTSPSSM